jgi:hypothetical protein
LAIACCAGAIGLHRGYRALNAQVSNSIGLAFHSRRLNSIRDARGEYPLTYEAVDHWGRPVTYRRTASGFVLWSFGEDGVPDADTGEGERRPGQRLRPNCFVAHRDTLFDQAGAVQACLK